MNSEQLELVTAYVDGEATPDERVRVEADAGLLAESDRQRAARAGLHDVEPPSAAARESAIAAALAVFDDEVAPAIPASPHGTRDVTAPTNIVPFDQRRRMRWMQGVGAAAAVAAVVVAGAVIATRDGDDDGSTADEMRDNTELSVGSTPLDHDTTVPVAAAEVATTAASVLMAVEPTDEPASDAASAADAESPATEPVSEYEADTGSGGAPAAPPPTSNPAAAAAPAPATTTTARMIVVITDDDLRELADGLKSPPSDVDVAETACDGGTIAADAMFEGDDGEQHPIVVVAVDDDRIGALTLDDCDVVLEAELEPGT